MAQSRSGVRHHRAMPVWFGGVILSSGLAAAADLGGFFADQQKALAIAAEEGKEPTCPQVIVRAAPHGSALAAYCAGLCCLQAEQPDNLAPMAWLSRAADPGFMPAHRLLRSVLIAVAEPHGGALPLAGAKPR